MATSEEADNLCQEWNVMCVGERIMMNHLHTLKFHHCLHPQLEDENSELTRRKDYQTNLLLIFIECSTWSFNHAVTLGFPNSIAITIHCYVLCSASVVQLFKALMPSGTSHGVSFVASPKGSGFILGQQEESIHSVKKE